MKTTIIKFILIVVVIISCTPEKNDTYSKTCKEHWKDSYSGIAYLTNKLTGETCSYEAILNSGKGFTSEAGLWFSIKSKTSGYCFYFQDEDYWSFLTYCDPDSIDDEFINDNFRSTIKIRRYENNDVFAQGKYYEKDDSGNMTLVGEITFEYYD